jgi:hypothetical protein
MNIAKKIHLRENEEILEILRRHSLTCFHIYAFGLFLMVAASFFATWLLAQGWWGVALYSLIMFCGFYIIFRTWFFARVNVLAITSERVVDIARTGWLDETVSSVGYTDIIDVSFRKSGIFASLLNYGDIFLQTKSKMFILEVTKIRQPQKVASFILEQIEFFRGDRRELSIEEVYRKFIKIIPDLSDEELEQVDQIIHEQWEEIDN